MLADLTILLGTLTLMGLVALRKCDLASGAVAHGRTEEASTNRLLVLLQTPLLFVVSLTFIGVSDAFKHGPLAMEYWHQFLSHSSRW